VGLVATLDDDFSQFFSRIIITKREELHHGLKGVVQQALDAYFKAQYKINQKKASYPENIIFYREGLGEGQQLAITEQEVTAIREGFRLVDPNYDPKLAYIFINKKINQRFFTDASAVQHERGGKGHQTGLSNPPSGTVVYDHITSHKFDFFLAAQKVT
jgi:aubergine-like protein